MLSLLIPVQHDSINISHLLHLILKERSYFYAVELHPTRIANELGIKLWQVESVNSLITEGSTVPFIARYRKEQTGSLDEVVIANIRDRLAQLAELDKRREAILSSLQERELLTDDLNKLSKRSHP